MKKKYVMPKAFVIDVEFQPLNDFSVSNQQTYEMGAKESNTQFQYDEEDNNNE